MSRVCEHEFVEPDPKSPGYSLVEYDLYARLNLTLRKNLATGEFEFIDISTKEVKYRYQSLTQAVHAANALEGDENTVIECGAACPLKRMEP